MTRVNGKTRAFVDLFASPGPEAGGMAEEAAAMLPPADLSITLEPMGGTERRAFVTLTAHTAAGRTAAMTPAPRRPATAAWAPGAAAGAPAHRAGATILAVRIWPAPDYSRVTIESDALLTVRQQFVASPPRLAVDIEASSSTRPCASWWPSSRPTTRTSAASAPGSSRLAWSGWCGPQAAVLPQVFTLPPIAAYQHRLVFDLYPDAAGRPAGSLIAERMRDSRSGATAPPVRRTSGASRPAGELIARQTTRPAPPAGQPTAPVLIAPDADSARVTAEMAQQSAAPTGSSSWRWTRATAAPGAIGPNGTREKDVVLQIATACATASTPPASMGSPMRAFLTRDADFFVPLHVRVQKARRVQADLFVSIHADAFSRPPKGAACSR